MLADAIPEMDFRMPSKQICGWHSENRQSHAAVCESTPAFFLTPRIFLVLFFRSLICFLDLLTGASASPFCSDRIACSIGSHLVVQHADKPIPL